MKVAGVSLPRISTDRITALRRPLALAAFSGIGRAEESRRLLMAQLAAGLLACGGVLGLASLLLDADGRNDTAVVATSLGFLAIAGVTLVLRRRLTQLGFDLLTVVATLLVTSYILFGGGTQALFPLLYVWVAAYAAYFYPARRVALHTGLMVAAYGLVILFGRGRSIDAASWVVAAGTVVAVSGLILLLRTLAEGLLGDLVADQQALRDSEERFRLLAESAFEGILVHEDGRIVEANRAGAELLGFEPEELQGQEVRPLVHEDSLEVLRAAARAGIETPIEAVAVRKDGSHVAVEVVSRTVPYRGREARVIAVRDITDRKKAEQQVEFLAYHDTLTGLGNRAKFAAGLERALARARAEDHAVAVLYLDLDDFKAVNDSLGHAAGDELLRHVASRLRAAARDHDLLARQGGDEFLLLLDELPLAETGYSTDVAEAVATRLVETMRAPVAVGETSVSVSASVGISVFPLDAADGDQLLRYADAAMYESKRRGPGGFLPYARLAA
jgi:diguanylate cyclase (GGDEF)-like protein/PAS domain S-box-containing protein